MTRVNPLEERLLQVLCSSFDPFSEHFDRLRTWCLNEIEMNLTIAMV